jgi:hypothetical protein
VPGEFFIIVPLALIVIWAVDRHIARIGGSPAKPAEAPRPAATKGEAPPQEERSLP